MSEPAKLTCSRCQSSHAIRFCRDCAFLTCDVCLVRTTQIIYSCPTCHHSTESEVCGTCGSETKVEADREENRCPSCNSKNIEDPELLVNNISSDYYTVINRVKDVNSELADLYRSFDFMVALVRFCRLAGLLGLPQMEMQLEKVSNALNKINDQAIQSLTSIRQEGLYDIRTHNYFKEIKLQHYRSLDGVLKNTEDKIENHLARIRHWIKEVKTRIDQLTPTAIFLRKHYEMLAEISRFLPPGVHDVAAIIPPIAMNVRTTHRKIQDECYIVFTEEFCVFLPKQALHTTEDQVINGVKIPYAEFVQRKRVHSLLKGTQMNINLQDGEIIISAPPQVLDSVEDYFGLIDAEEPYMVGSPKKIISIENSAADKNEYKRAAGKFINIFQEWLFDDRVQESQKKEKLELPSVTELKNQLDRLEKMYSSYNYQARHRQIPLDEYQNETAQIKDNYSSIKDTLSKLSGHFGDIDPGLLGQ